MLSYYWHKAAHSLAIWSADLISMGGAFRLVSWTLTLRSDLFKQVSVLVAAEAKTRMDESSGGKELCLLGMHAYEI